MKNGTLVRIITMQSGIRKKVWPMTSMVSRTFFGQKLLTMSIRICSLLSSVHGAHSRNTIPNSTHCNSSHAFDDSSSSLRTVALALEIRTATRISHDKWRPIHELIASIP